MAGETLLEFPCDFPIKIMGEATDEFRSLAVGIVSRHFGAPDAGSIVERHNITLRLGQLHDELTDAV